MLLTFAYIAFNGSDDSYGNEAMFDKGTPQCDKGTWYEENGYCD